MTVKGQLVPDKDCFRMQQKQKNHVQFISTNPEPLKSHVVYGFFNLTVLYNTYMAANAHLYFTCYTELKNITKYKLITKG